MTDLKDRQENTLAVVEACIAVDMDYKVNNAIENASLASSKINNLLR